MAFCGSCGAQVQDGIKFCQTCGRLAIVIGVSAIVGIVNAASGKMKPLPVIGRITIIK